MKIKAFRATRKTNRFNKNQRVWVVVNGANMLKIVFKYRGSGRYVNGVVDKFASCVGELTEIEVAEDFAKRLILKHYRGYVNKAGRIDWHFKKWNDLQKNMKNRKPPPPPPPPSRKVRNLNLDTGEEFKPLDEALNDLFLEIVKALRIPQLAKWLTRLLSK